MIPKYNSMDRIKRSDLRSSQYSMTFSGRNSKGIFLCLVLDCPAGCNGGDGSMRNVMDAIRRPANTHNLLNKRAGHGLTSIK